MKNEIYRMNQDHRTMKQSIKNKTFKCSRKNARFIFYKKK